MTLLRATGGYYRWGKRWQEMGVALHMLVSTQLSSDLIIVAQQLCRCWFKCKVMKEPLIMSVSIYLSNNERVARHLHRRQHRCKVMPLSICVIADADAEQSFHRSAITSMQWATLLSLCICVDIDVVIERRKGRSTFASTALSSFNNCIDVDEEIERQKSRSATTSMSMQIQSDPYLSPSSFHP